MEPVTVTVTKTWSSIDIYLFSNGQQYSPPRKYHLKSEELQWWGATLSFLGRTQYGSGHSSIDLYTIDGTKIIGPLELINGSAYVAVEPPDTFINTGYEHYLIKASRSWEKRLAQKTYSTERSNPGNILEHPHKRPPDPKLESKDFQLDSTTADVNITEENVVNDRVSMQAAKEATTAQIKAPAIKPLQLPKRKSITNTRQIKKRNSLDTQNATLKRMSAESDKTSPFTRYKPLKTTEIVKRNRSSIPRPSKLCEKNLEQQEQAISSKKINIKTTEDRDDEVNEIQSNLKAQNTAENCHYPLFPINEELNRDTETEKDTVLNSIYFDEDQTVISLYRNEDLKTRLNDSEIDIIINEAIQQRKIPKNNESNECKQDTEGIKKLNVLNHDTHGLSPNDDLPNKEEEIKRTSDITTYNNYNKNKLNNEDNFTHNSINMNATDKQVTDEYIALMNQGGLLHLKFNIKIKDCKTLYNRDKYNNIQNTTAYTNSSKTEKTSQVNIDINFSGELLNSNYDRRIETETLQSLFNKLKTEDVNNALYKSPKLLLLQCPCHQIDRDYKCVSICECQHGDRQYETIPIQILNNTPPCCDGSTGVYRNSKDVTSHGNDPDPSAVMERTPSLPVTNGTRVKSLAQKFENLDSAPPIERHGNNVANNSKSTSDDGRSVVLTKLNNAPTLRRISEIPNEEDIASPRKCTCDKSVQTTWSNLLLEARQHENDNYTFHLPSLYLLKLCKL